MQILLTGLCGFTGQYVKKELENAGHSVIGLRGNLTDTKAIADEVVALQPQAVIHLAAIAFVGHGDANAFYKVNLMGSRNLLQALSLLPEPPSHVVLVSSANIYGNTSEGLLSEEMQANPANDYAVSKYAMELMSRLWTAKLPITLVRPFNYTGLGQDNSFLIPKIVSHFKRREAVIELGNLDIWREFNDVRFVAKTYAKLVNIAPTLSGQVLNVCSGITHSLREVITLCEQITGHSIEVKVNPEFIRHNEVRILKGENSRLRNLVGNEYEHYDLETTLRWMLSS